MAARLLLMLLVQHRHAVFPALRGIPRANRSVFRIIRFATADPDKHTAKQKKQEPFDGAAFHFRKPDARG